jgi:hypothetical protein
MNPSAARGDGGGRLKPTRAAPLPTPWKIVVVYDDVPAGQRAERLLVSLRRILGAEAAMLPLAWSLEQLISLSGRCRATTDATNADLIVLSTTKPAEMPEAINRWLDTCLIRKRGQESAVINLFGAEEMWPVSLGRPSASSSPTSSSTPPPAVIAV